MRLKVWKWNHTWDDGHESYLYPSEEALMTALHRYVQDQCHDMDLAAEGAVFTGNQSEDISAYFDYVSEYEWYGIDSQMVNFPDLEPDQEVVLTSDECALTVLALEFEHLSELAQQLLGMSEAQANEAIQSAYQKLKD